MFLESSYGWYMSFMFQLLDKLAQIGAAENIFFDWWSPNVDNDKENDAQDDTADKNKMQEILLNLCYKVGNCNIELIKRKSENWGAYRRKNAVAQL